MLVACARNRRTLFPSEEQSSIQRRSCAHLCRRDCTRIGTLAFAQCCISRSQTGSVDCARVCVRSSAELGNRHVIRCRLNRSPVRMRRCSNLVLTLCALCDGVRSLVLSAPCSCSENILLSHDGHVCLTDFGLSKDVDPTDKAHTCESQLRSERCRSKRQAEIQTLDRCSPFFV